MINWSGCLTSDYYMIVSLINRHETQRNATHGHGKTVALMMKMKATFAASSSVPFVLNVMGQFWE